MRAIGVTLCFMLLAFVIVVVCLLITGAHI